MATASTAQKPDTRLAVAKRAIFAACRPLGIGDEERRSIIKQVTGKESSSHLELAEALAVLDHLDKSGAKARSDKPDWTWVFKCPRERQNHLRKIFKLAERVGALAKPPVPVASVEYVTKILRKASGNDTPARRAAVAVDLRLASATDLHLVVQILECWLRDAEERPVGPASAGQGGLKPAPQAGPTTYPPIWRFIETASPGRRELYEVMFAYAQHKNVGLAWIEGMAARLHGNQSGQHPPLKMYDLDQLRGVANECRRGMRTEKGETA